MGNLFDKLSGVQRNGLGAFEMELGPEHLGVPAELAPYSDAWNFVPVDDDPFEDPKDKVERLKKEAEANARKKAAKHA